MTKLLSLIILILLLAGCVSTRTSERDFTNSEPYFRGGSYAMGSLGEFKGVLKWSFTLPKDEQFNILRLI